jgi:diguanylate cyclase (GGDEF)-like protein
LALNSTDTAIGPNVRGSTHARLSVVVPVGITVTVAILCVIVAVLGSAQRADDVTLDTERQLLSRALSNYSDRILREVEAVAISEAAHQNIRADLDPNWIRPHVHERLQTSFNHDFVFVTDSSNRLLYNSLASQNIDPNLLESIQQDLKPTLDLLRGHGEADGAHNGEPTGANAVQTLRRPPQHGAARLQAFLNRPAIVAAAVVTANGQIDTDTTAPAVVSVKFIDNTILADIASRLHLNNLDMVAEHALSEDAYVFDLTDGRGQSIVQLAWIPKRPGAEIVSSIIPFVAVVLVGFALLAAFALRHVRHTTATIAANESQLRYLAHHDPLCGLPNRHFFSERLEETIKEVKTGGPPAAVFYIDLDHFKDVNDTLGHPTGDELIRAVTHRLTHTLRADDLIARIGGDEFAVITSSGRDHTTLQSIADRLIEALCASYTVNDKTIAIGASIGIAVVHEHIAGAADIMRHADMALYRAKNEGRNRACIYDTAMDVDLLQRKLVEIDLRSAVDRDELHLAYQPIVNNSGEKIVGVEALCRWTHPERGVIHPSEFIPIAENSGLIVDLGERVLRRACLDGKEWPGITVSVNVSALQFRRADFVDVVERIITETGFDPTRLELEVTESTLFGNVDSAELAMFRLKALGVRLALDDFGTGYSSLLYLRRFPFDKLKVDRSFVLAIERAADAAAIVHAVVGLGRGLGMKVTAEGVETAEQQLFLRAAGVHSMQGYRFGRPGAATVITNRLAAPETFRIVDETANLARAG